MSLAMPDDSSTEKQGLRLKYLLSKVATDEKKT